MSYRTAIASIEALEGRQFLSASVIAAVSADSSMAVSPKLTATPSLLTKTQVIGHYKGSLTESTGKVLELKFTVTTTRVVVTIPGVGTLTGTLSSTAFKRIRGGTFKVVSFVSGGAGSVTLNGKVTKAGARISGSYSTSTSKTGTFFVKKY